VALVGKPVGGWWLESVDRLKAVSVEDVVDGWWGGGLVTE